MAEEEETVDDAAELELAEEAAALDEAALEAAAEEAAAELLLDEVALEELTALLLEELVPPVPVVLPPPPPPPPPPQAASARLNMDSSRADFAPCETLDMTTTPPGRDHGLRCQKASDSTFGHGIGIMANQQV